MGLIRIGRTIFHSRWVLEGYKWFILRPKPDVISEEEAHYIGQETASKLRIIRQRCSVSGGHPSVDFVERELRSWFTQELSDLKRRELEYPSKLNINDVPDAAGDEEECEGEGGYPDLRISATDGEDLKLEMNVNRPIEKVAELKQVNWLGDEEGPNEQVTPLLSQNGESSHGRQQRSDDARRIRDEVRYELLQQEAALREKEGEYAAHVKKWRGLVDNPGKAKRRVRAKWEAKYQSWNKQLLSTRRDIQSVRAQLQLTVQGREEQDEEQEVPVVTPRAWGAVPVYSFRSR